ncbi:MAG: carbohydrate ABC transporter permease [Clostridia bacterium]|nr:carbohydrate ABC transporter permease [Clostridia bacterium]
MINEAIIRKGKRIAQKTFIYAVLVFVAFTILIPFYVIIITSLKESHALATHIPFIWFPKFGELSFRAYGNLFTSYPVIETGKSMVLTGIGNTFLIVIPTTVVGMISSSVSAYAFAKLRFWGKNFFFSALLFTMMMPGIVMLIPSYIIFDYLGLTDTYFPLMVPAMFGSAQCVFFLRQFFSGIPDEVLDAAKLDGVGYLGIYWRIMLPLSLPAIFAQAILGFVAGYNDYLAPLIYIVSEKKYTLQIALQFFSGGNLKDLPTVMAGAVMAIIPTTLIYVFAQRYFVEGIAITGLKA